MSVGKVYVLTTTREFAAWYQRHAKVDPKDLVVLTNRESVLGMGRDIEVICVTGDMKSIDREREYLSAVRELKARGNKITHFQIGVDDR